MKIYKLTAIKFGALIKDLGVTPGSLFPLEFGHKGRLINAMLYDHWHGNGYVLDMLTGCFVEDRSTTQPKGTQPICNHPDSQKET